jgi:Tfp pilus assembly protein PilX
MTTKRLQRLRTDDGGAILVIVLLFVLVVSLLVTAIADQTRASIGNALIVRGQQTKVYAADAGIEYGISALRADYSLCPDSAHPADLPTQTIDGRSVDVHCDTVTGTSSGLRGNAIITLDRTAPSLATQSGGGGVKEIGGSIYSSWLDDSIQLTVKDGSVREQRASGAATSCSTDADKPSGLTFTAPLVYGYRCTTDAAPDPGFTLPTSPVAPAPPQDVVGTCTTFFPGRYGTAGSPSTLPLTAQNYFVSGVYYFESVTLDFNGGKTGVAGRMGPGDTNINGDTPCSNDSAGAAVGLPATTAGAKFILGGSSRIHVGNSPGDHLEIFSRQFGAATEGSQEVSVISVTSANLTGAGSGFVASSLGPSDAIVGVDSGDKPQLVVHGAIDVANALVDFNATNASEAQLRDGVRAMRFKLQSSASASGLNVGVKARPDKRVLRITATAKGAAGEKPIVAQAVIELQNDASHTGGILSWRTSS